MELVAILVVVALFGYVINLRSKSVSPVGIVGALGMLVGGAVCILFVGPFILMLIVYTAGPLFFLIAVPCLIMLIGAALTHRKV
jgi:hypothetical protein